MKCGLVHWTGVSTHTRIDGIPCLVSCSRGFIHFGPHRDAQYGWEWTREDERGHHIAKIGRL